jgi:DNA repair photolyase
MGDTFTPYWGDFLVSPVPIELSFNYCSHSCQYCFSNLNRPDRRADIKATMNLLSEYQERETFVARLLQEKYPVLVSNRVDPFAGSNWRQSLPVFEAMAGMGIPFTIQTKGGRGVDELLDFCPPTVWYISIALLDEKKRAEIEPGAPSIQSRFELISKLKEKGHEVVIGVNPCVPEWLPENDAQILMEEFRERGVWGVWCQLLHLNHKQLAGVNAKGKAAMGEGVLKECTRRKVSGDRVKQLEYFRDMVTGHGLEVYTVTQGNQSYFFDPFTRLYPKLFPTIQDFINRCYEIDLPDYSLISFRDFASFMLPYLPGGTGRIGDYLKVGIKSQITYREVSSTRYHTFESLLRIGWNETSCDFNLTQFWCFSYATYDGKVLVDDDEGLPMILFRRSRFEELYFELR